LPEDTGKTYDSKWNILPNPKVKEFSLPGTILTKSGRANRCSKTVKQTKVFEKVSVVRLFYPEDTLSLAALLHNPFTRK
jgi:hypothetical protein